MGRTENPDPALSLSNLLHPEVLADPYPFYHRLRSQAPVLWDSECWVVTRYADVLALLHDPRLSAAGMGWEADLPDREREMLGPLFRSLSRWMGFLDPPDHTRLRGLVHKAFRPRVIEGLRPHAREIVDRVLDAAYSSRGMDVIRDLAAPLPVIVIAEMLGLPPGDLERLKRWSDDLATFVARFDFPSEELPQLARSLVELTTYLRGVVAERRRRPGSDLISGLLAAEEKGEMLDEDELLANCVLLLFAGHETTTDLIGNGMAALLRHPGQAEKLRADPSLIGSAVEELLRYDCPAQLTVRVAREEIELDGKRIRAGERVTLMLGAANRDPAQFPEPDRLEIARRENQHVAFGHGIHFCLGAALARLEGQIAIGALVRRLPDLRLAADTLEWRPSQALRGLRSLPIGFSEVKR